MSNSYPHILIIQTAFIGDVILATSLIESLATAKLSQKIDILVRRGNESLLQGNPHINKVLAWDKKTKKYRHLFFVLKEIRKQKYDLIINVQRFASTGFLTAFSGAKEKSGFGKNPFSFAFTKVVQHDISQKSQHHEITRNHELIADFQGISNKALTPKLYPSAADYEAVNKYISNEYIVIAPGSVWFTKQFPKEKWIEVVRGLPMELKVMFIGGGEEKALSDEIILASKNKKCINLCGRLTFMESAALMQKAKRCLVNDSAPLHIASAVNARTTAIFCSTIPEYGFGPLAEDSIIVESQEKLECRPCGLHGKKSCPEQHFDCGYKISVNDIINSIE